MWRTPLEEGWPIVPNPAFTTIFRIEAGTAAFSPAKRGPVAHGSRA